MPMTADSVVTVVTGVFQTGGIATFLYFLFRGLRQQITNLNATVEQQQKTLDVMERRIVETEKFGEMYRRMLSDLPGDMDKFKQVISHVKDATIAELEKANQSKDEKLKGLTELELKKIEVTEKAIQELPALRQELLATVTAIEQRVETALRYVPERAAEERFVDSLDDSFWIQYLRAPRNRHRGVFEHEPPYGLLDRVWSAFASSAVNKEPIVLETTHDSSVSKPGVQPSVQGDTTPRGNSEGNDSADEGRKTTERKPEDVG